MKSNFKVPLFCSCLTAGLMALPSQAVPTLQVDIEGGFYDNSTETIIASGNPFNLWALISGGVNPDATYYIAAAIVPQTENPPLGNFGSFTVDGVLYNSGNMSFGTPPVDDPDFNPENLGSHGIYDTHFAEISFVPDANKTATEYNAQDNPGGLVADPLGTLVYEDFLVDVSGIANGYAVHFDFYTVGEITRGNRTGTVILNFAPFSHDGQSGKVPDGGATAALLGLGFLGLAALSRKRS